MILNTLVSQDTERFASYNLVPKTLFSFTTSQFSLAKVLTLHFYYCPADVKTGSAIAKEFSSGAVSGGNRSSVPGHSSKGVLRSHAAVRIYPVAFDMARRQMVEI